MFVGGHQRLLESETSKPTRVSQTLKRFVRYFQPYWPQYLLVLVLMLIGTWTQVTAPTLMGQAVDCYLIPATVGLSSQEGSPLDQFLGSQQAASTANCSYLVQPE
ncbi:MAG TPA: ABC transporter ATP-binding protein, partial [Anaerolineales bacterium]